MIKRKKVKLNVRFKEGKIICAKSPDECKDCEKECEKMDFYYYPFNNRDLMECFKNNEKRR